MILHGRSSQSANAACSRARRAFGQAAVGNLASQRVLERVLVLAGQVDVERRRMKSRSSRRLDVRHRPLDQLVHRPRPEDASDDRRRLKGRFLGASEQIDAGRQTAWTESGMAGPG